MQYVGCTSPQTYIIHNFKMSFQFITSVCVYVVCMCNVAVGDGYVKQMYESLWTHTFTCLGYKRMSRAFLYSLETESLTEPERKLSIFTWLEGASQELQGSRYQGSRYKPVSILIQADITNTCSHRLLHGCYKPTYTANILTKSHLSHLPKSFHTPKVLVLIMSNVSIFSSMDYAFILVIIKGSLIHKYVEILQNIICIK